MKHTSTYQELLQIAVIALALLVMTQGLMQHARVEGLSMAPALAHGDHLVVNKLAYARFEIPFFKRNTTANSPAPRNYVFSAPDRGDIVVFTPPAHVPHKHALVKRIVGMPGETIAINNHGVYINGQKHAEPYLPGSFYDLTESSSISQSNVFEVELGHYFVMGDNREYSNDSRSWGTLPAQNITGKVWVTLPPWKIWDLPQDLFGNDS